MACLFCRPARGCAGDTACVATRRQRANTRKRTPHALSTSSPPRGRRQRQRQRRRPAAAAAAAATDTTTAAVAAAAIATTTVAATATTTAAATTDTTTAAGAIATTTAAATIATTTAAGAIAAGPAPRPRPVAESTLPPTSWTTSPPPASRHSPSIRCADHPTSESLATRARRPAPRARASGPRVHLASKIPSDDPASQLRLFSRLLTRPIPSRPLPARRSRRSAAAWT